jgi:hypothetical protein
VAKRQIPWIKAGTAAIVVLIVAMLMQTRGTVEGYYRTQIMKPLDGSKGYLHLHEGAIDVVCLREGNPDTRVPLGTYRIAPSRNLEVTFFDPQIPPAVATVARLRLIWPHEFSQGWPDGEYCPREFAPWYLYQLDKVK